MQEENNVLPHIIEEKIFTIRGRRAILDKDLADLYHVSTKNLNRAVSRNAERFSGDFCFQLTQEETQGLRFHFGTSSSDYGGRRYLPYAFTEHGVAMLSAVLRSERAVQMSIFIVRAFVKMRELMAENTELAQKIAEIELHQKKQSDTLASVISVVKQLIDPPRPKDPPGFKPTS